MAISLSPVLSALSSPAFDAALVFSIVFSYLFYSFVYLKPAVAGRLMSQDTLIRNSASVKEIAIALCALECFLSQINWVGVALGAPFLLIGQLLNSLVMHKLGRVKA
jgi:hypothetical protein